MKKQFPHLETHQKAGIQVKALYKLIVDLSNSTIGRKYSQSHEINKILSRMYKDAMHLKNVLDDAVCEEFTTMPDNQFLINIYYASLTDWQRENIHDVMHEVTSELRQSIGTGPPKGRDEETK